jgi:hypothetical protein
LKIGWGEDFIGNFTCVMKKKDSNNHVSDKEYFTQGMVVA